MICHILVWIIFLIPVLNVISGFIVLILIIGELNTNSYLRFNKRPNKLIEFLLKKK